MFSSDKYVPVIDLTGEDSGNERSNEGDKALGSSTSGDTTSYVKTIESGPDSFLITVDIGRVNLSYCVVLATTNEVIALELIKVLPGSTAISSVKIAEHVGTLVDRLCRIYQPGQSKVHVIMEEQPRYIHGRGHRSVTVNCIIEACLHMRFRGKGATTSSVAPLSICAHFKIPRTRKEKKQMTQEIVEQDMELKIFLDVPHAIRIKYKACKKRDDLADCMLLAIHNITS
jgi:hypothetical protein